jgi:hypothetical protein
MVDLHTTVVTLGFILDAHELATRRERTGAPSIHCERGRLLDASGGRIVRLDSIAGISIRAGQESELSLAAEIAAACRESSLNASHPRNLTHYFSHTWRGRERGLWGDRSEKTDLAIL